MAFVTGAEILALAGVTAPVAAETDWATAVAAAINAGMTAKLNGAVITDPSPAQDELEVAARLAGVEAYKRKEATFGITGYADLQGAAIRVARDYLASVAPMIERYSAGPGIG